MFIDSHASYFYFRYVQWKRDCIGSLGTEGVHPDMVVK
jgi:hypothetical protein